jgi:hypothetical protein
LRSSVNGAGELSGWIRKTLLLAPQGWGVKPRKCWISPANITVYNDLTSKNGDLVAPAIIRMESIENCKVIRKKDLPN